MEAPITFEWGGAIVTPPTCRRSGTVVVPTIWEVKGAVEALPTCRRDHPLFCLPPSLFHFLCTFPGAISPPMPSGVQRNSQRLGKSRSLTLPHLRG